MPNVNSGIVNGKTPTNASVGTTPAVVVSANPRRKGLVISNISTGSVWIGVGNTSTLNAGIFLKADSGTWSMDDYMFTTDAISAVAHAAASIISIQEFE